MWTSEPLSNTGIHVIVTVSFDVHISFCGLYEEKSFTDAYLLL